MPSDLTQDYTSVDGSPLPRCNQETHFSAQSSARRARCPAEHVVNPNNVFRIIQNIDLQKETAHQRAVQVKPQHVSLKLRISELPGTMLCVSDRLSWRISLSAFQLKYRSLKHFQMFLSKTLLWIG